MIYYTSNEFYCTECGNKGYSIMNNGSLIKKGHLKELFCVTCGRETNHIEVNEGSNYTRKDFKKEFELGRFINGKRIPVSDLMNCPKADCRYNKGYRCWNANHSYNCSYQPYEVD